MSPNIYEYQKQDGEAFAREEQEFMERIQFERFNTEWGESCKKHTFAGSLTEQTTP
jgi:hypothetical protein